MTLTKEQQSARDLYELALKQEERYRNSMFATPERRQQLAARTKAAFERCIELVGVS